MGNARVEPAGSADQHAAWMSRQHDRLDARLASAFLQTVWGSGPEARREFGAYRHDLSAHLEQAKRRFFSVAPLDGRTEAIERFEWRAHRSDLEQALAAVDRELRLPTLGRHEAFAALRRATRRQRRHEHHLLELVSTVGTHRPHLAEVYL